jgi:glucose-1-phosphate thymidylyltransferase
MAETRQRKGIVLAGGTGARLHPATLAVSKQLLPIFDKPMIYYPLSVLMLAGIRDILIISTPLDLPRFEQLFAGGERLGIRLEYAVQERPDGLAQALTIAAPFIGPDDVALVLGDNVFYGHALPRLLSSANDAEAGATIFAHHVSEPHRYGIVEIGSAGQAISLEEKPAAPKSNFAVTGLYFYDNKAVEYARHLQPSARGELEITDINRAYLAAGALRIEILGRGYAWFDTGTHDSLLEASQFIATVERRQGTQIACLEEIAFNNGWITASELRSIATSMLKSSYGEYLMELLSEGSWR